VQALKPIVAAVVVGAVIVAVAVLDATEQRELERFGNHENSRFYSPLLVQWQTENTGE
jgi:hypothetical protein